MHVRVGVTIGLVLVAAAACSAGAEPAPEPLARSRATTAAELPPRLRARWEHWMTAEGADGTGYRVGGWETPLDVFATGRGDVFLDRDGGGMLLAERCAALEVFLRRNGSMDAAAGCLDGAPPRPSSSAPAPSR